MIMTRDLPSYTFSPFSESCVAKSEGIIEMLEEEDAENAKKQLESAAVIDAAGKEEEKNQACPPDGIIEMQEEEDAEHVKKQLESAAVIDAEDKSEDENQACGGQRKESRSGSGSTLASLLPPAFGAVCHAASGATCDLSLADLTLGSEATPAAGPLPPKYTADKENASSWHSVIGNISSAVYIALTPSKPKPEKKTRKLFNAVQMPAHVAGDPFAL